MAGGLVNGTSWAAQMLPWIVIANIAVTLIAIFLFRVFAAGQWAQQQQQVAAAVKQLTEEVADEHRLRRELSDALNVGLAKLALQVAVIDERIKHLERGGAGRN